MNHKGVPEGMFSTSDGFVVLFACPVHGKDYMMIGGNCGLCGFTQADGERNRANKVNAMIRAIEEDERKKAERALLEKVKEKGEQT
jgi:hypothetical protein